MEPPPDSEAGQIEQQALDAAGATRDDFARAGRDLPGARRPVIVKRRPGRPRPGRRARAGGRWAAREVQPPLRKLCHGGDRLAPRGPKRGANRRSTGRMTPPPPPPRRICDRFSRMRPLGGRFSGPGERGGGARARREPGRGRGADAVSEAMASAKSRLRLDLERNLGVLGTLGNNAPFIGLFGTVLGIIKAFADLARNQGGGAAAVMAGISEALVATAVGLLVAIPAVVAFNYFQGRVRRALGRVDAMAHLILSATAGDERRDGERRRRAAARAGRRLAPWRAAPASSRTTTRGRHDRRHQRHAAGRHHAGAADHLHGDGDLHREPGDQGRPAQGGLGQRTGQDHAGADPDQGRLPLPERRTKQRRRRRASSSATPCPRTPTCRRSSPPTRSSRTATSCT